MAIDHTIDFVGYHVPRLPSAVYTITADQTVKTVETSTIPDTAFPQQRRRVFVGGPRFGLDPSAVVGAFPPPGSLGDHSAVLPHVLLEPSTTPWQRQSLISPPRQPGEPPLSDELAKQIRTTPWLALLVFDQAEAPEPAVVRVGDLAARGTHPALAHEPGQSDDEKVTVIDVEQELLARLLPTPTELPYLAHVRRHPGRAGGAPVERAVVLANRVPRSGSGSVVHVVSLEHRAALGLGGDWAYDIAGFQPKDLVRLVSLYHWSFACTGNEHTFHGLSERLDRDPGPLVLPRAAPRPVVRVSVDEAGVPFATAAGEAATFAEAGSVPARSNPPFGWGLEFEGDVADHLSVTDPFGDLTDFTVSVWAKPVAIDDGAYHGILGRQEGARRSPGLWIAPSDGALHFDSYDDEGTRFHGLVPGFFTAPGVWVHITWVKRGREYSFYRDGAPLGTSPAPVRAVSAGPDLWIGRVDNAWAGLLCDVRVYGRGLSVEEVRALPTLGRGDQPELVSRLTDGGLVPLAHDLRTGDATVSWYRGPLQGGHGGEPGDDVSVDHPDGLLRYLADVGMFDASYAAAAELGRQLMLRSTRAAVELYRWKLAMRKHEHRRAQRRVSGHLFEADDSPPRLPEPVATFLDDLAALHGVPFRYLVPDERLLPAESLRYVHVDRQWVVRLVAGALSVGGSLVGEAANALASDVVVPDTGSVTGVLLRSQLVHAWPELVLNAYDVSAPHRAELTIADLDVIRVDRPADGVLLALFRGQTRTLDMHLAPEQIHFGFRHAKDRNGRPMLTKPLHAGSRRDVEALLSPVPMRAEPGKPARGGTVDVARLVDQLGDVLGLGPEPLDVADFALEMVEGVPKVRFVLV